MIFHFVWFLSDGFSSNEIDLRNTYFICHWQFIFICDTSDFSSNVLFPLDSLWPSFTFVFTGQMTIRITKSFDFFSWMFQWRILVILYVFMGFILVHHLHDRNDLFMIRNYCSGCWLPVFETVLRPFRQLVQIWLC